MANGGGINVGSIFASFGIKTDESSIREYKGELKRAVEDATRTERKIKETKLGPDVDDRAFDKLEREQRQAREDALKTERTFRSAGAGMGRGLTAGAKGADGLGRASGGAGKAVGGLNRAMIGTAAGITAMLGISAVTSALKDLVSVAMDADTAERRAIATLEAAGVSYAANKKAIDAHVESMMKLGFDDEDALESYANLVQLTGSHTEALELSSIAADFARKNVVDLGTATGIVTKVYAGQTRVLKQFGYNLDAITTSQKAAAKSAKDSSAAAKEAYTGQIKAIDEWYRSAKAKITANTKDDAEARTAQIAALDDQRRSRKEAAQEAYEQAKAQIDSTKAAGAASASEADKIATRERALGFLQKKLAGQSKAYSESSAGAVARLQVAWENLKEELGTRLMPYVERLANWATEGGGFDKLEKALASVGRALKPYVEMLGRAVEWASENEDQAQSYASALIKVALAWGAVSAAASVINVAAALGPIGVVLAIAAAVALVAVKSDKVHRGWQYLKEDIADLKTGMNDFGYSAGKSVRDAFGSAEKKLNDFGTNSGAAFRKGFGDAAGWVGKSFQSVWKTLSGMFSDLARKAVGVGKSIIYGIAQGIKDAAGKVANNTSDAVRDLGRSARELISSPTAYFATGGKITRPMITVTGEEAPRHPEFVIATNPAYRARNVNLLAEAAGSLGMRVEAYAKGGKRGREFGGVPGSAAFDGRAAAWRVSQALAERTYGTTDDIRVRENGLRLYQQREKFLKALLRAPQFRGWTEAQTAIRSELEGVIGQVASLNADRASAMGVTPVDALIAQMELQKKLSELNGTAFDDAQLTALYERKRGILQQRLSTTTGAARDAVASSLSQVVDTLIGIRGGAGTTPGGSFAEQASALLSARTDLYGQFGSNWRMASRSARESAATGGMGGRKVTLINNFKEVPTDPHGWARSAAFELGGAL